MKSFPRFWRNHPYCRNKWYLIWTGCLFSLRWSKKNKFFLKKKIQNGRLKKTSFSSSTNSQYFFMKISWIGPWVSRIDWCEVYWCGSTYMVMRLSNISSKTALFCFISMKTSSPFIWGTIYFCTMDCFFIILEKTSCTRLYELFSSPNLSTNCEQKLPIPKNVLSVIESNKGDILLFLLIAPLER